jgi:hypothetical protein
LLEAEDFFVERYGLLEVGDPITGVKEFLDHKKRYS